MLIFFFSRGAEKYFKRSRLNWPEGAVSRESIQAVKKLDRLKVLVVPLLLLLLLLFVVTNVITGYASLCSYGMIE